MCKDLFKIYYYVGQILYIFYKVCYIAVTSTILLVLPYSFTLVSMSFK